MQSGTVIQGTPIQCILLPSANVQGTPATSIPTQNSSVRTECASVVVPFSQPSEKAPNSDTGAPSEDSKPVQMARTHSFFHGDPAHYGEKNELTSSWTLSLLVDIPSNVPNPALRSLVYFIKYGTTFDNGDSTVQTDVVISKLPTSPNLPVGRVVSDSNDLGVYLGNKSGYGSRVVNEDVALPISVVPAVKSNAGNGSRSHYVDKQQLSPNVMIVTKGSKLYLNFHVDESPTAQTSRLLDIQVVATWSEITETKKGEGEGGGEGELTAFSTNFYPGSYNYGPIYDYSRGGGSGGGYGGGYGGCYGY